MNTQQKIPQARKIETAVLGVPEIETAVLGVLLTYNRCIPENIDKIQIDFFVNPVNQLIFSAIKEMYMLGKDVDILSLTIYLKNKNRLNEVGGVISISNLTKDVTSSSNIESWILILHEAQIKRNLIKMAQKITDDINSNRDCFEVMDNITDTLGKLYLNSENKVSTFSDCVDEMIEIIEDNRDPNATQRGLMSGISEYDKRGGLQQGDLIIIAGRTSQGKTSLGITIAVNISSSNGAKGAFYSLEMVKSQLTARIMSIKTQIPTNKILYSYLHEDDYNLIKSMETELKQCQLYFDDRSNASIDSIVSSIKMLVLKQKIKFAIIDYAQLVESNMKGVSEEIQLARIARRLKNLAKELSIPIILLSQLSREFGGNPEPKISQLRGSGQLEEAADVIILVYRPEYYQRDFPEPFVNQPTEGMAMLDFAKGRQIGIFKTLQKFNCTTTHFTDVPYMLNDGYVNPNNSFEEIKEEEAPY